MLWLASADPAPRQMGGDIDDLRNPQDDQWDEIMAKGPPAWSAGLCVEVWSHIDVKLVWQGPFSGMSGLRNPQCK